MCSFIYIYIFLIKTRIFSVIFTDEMRVTHLYSKISLVFSEDTVSVDEFFKAVKNIIV